MKHIQHKRKHNFVPLFLGLFFVVIVGFVGVRIRNSSTWDGNRRLNFVINFNPLLVVSLEPASKQASVIVFPTNTFVDVPHNLGFYKLSSVYQLGELHKSHGGGDLLRETLGMALGTPIEGYFSPKSVSFNLVINNRDDYRDFKSKILSLAKIHSSFNFWGRELKTNFSVWDTIRLWRTLHKMRSDQVEIYNLQKLDILSDQALPDKTIVKVIDPDKMDKVLEGIFEDANFRAENLSIQVSNATSISGVAHHIGRIITNMGGKLILASNASPLQTSCLLKTSKRNLSSYSVLRLEKIFSCQMESTAPETADINLIIGEGYLK